jgi:AcrR family transcriptional regulator
MAKDVKSTRVYDNRRRAEQALANQRRVLDAAHRELLNKGYADTTIAGIAEAAGVSIQMIYKTFGSKAALAKRVYDVTLVGDEEPIPLSRRPEIQAIIAESDPRRKLAMYAALGRTLLERLGPLVQVLLRGAKAGNTELAEFAAITARERLVGVTGLVGNLDATGALRPGLSVERARDILWTLIAIEVYDLLVVERGWSLDEWEAWVAESSAALLLGPPTADSSDFS